MYSIGILFFMLEGGLTDSQKYFVALPELGEWFTDDIKWNTKKKKTFPNSSYL